MKLVNPVGRMLAEGASIMPRACGCKPSGNYAAARSADDNCAHCGCTCTKGTNISGTHAAAYSSNNMANVSK